MKKEDADKNLKSFEFLLKDISTLDDKKRALWLQIYQNAVQDRQCAYDNYTTLLSISQDKSSEWAVHGRNLGVFLERMSKANDQLLKLAELVARELEKQQEVSSNDIFSKIQGN